MDTQPAFHIEGKTRLIATRRGRVLWRWRAQTPLEVVGVAEEILLVRERLRGGEVGAAYRITGLLLATGRRLWQAVYEGVSEENGELYGRLLLLYFPNGVYATGDRRVIDVRTGKTVLTTDGDLKTKTPREFLWVNLPGPPPYQHGGTLVLVRLDPRTLKSQSLDLPMPVPPGVGFDERPCLDARISGERIEALYSGYRDNYRQQVFFVARFRWSAGPNQKPEIQWLDRPVWPK